jgi:hypothetical protein
MNANVPEKIYLFENPISNEPDYRWLSKKSSDDDIEYTRTDAFIEKAIKYVANHFLAPGMDNEIKDFKNYMK